MKRPMGKIHCSGNIVHEPFKEFSAPMKSFQMAKTSSRPEAGSDFRLPLQLADGSPTAGALTAWCERFLHRG